MEKDLIEQIEKECELVIEKNIPEEIDVTQQKLTPKLKSLQKDLESVGFMERYIIVIDFKENKYKAKVYAQKL